MRRRVASLTARAILSLVLLCVFPFVSCCSVLWSYTIGGITALSVSENGDFVAVGCQNGYYYIFDTWGNLTGSGNLPSAVNALEIANTGDVLIGSAAGFTFCTRDGVQGSSFRTASVKTVSMSAEGTSSLVCSEGNIFINQGDSMAQQLQVDDDSPHGVMSSDSSLGCAASGRYLHLFVHDMFQEPLDVKEDIEHLFVSADGKMVVFSTKEKIGYIDVEKQELLLIALDSSITSMAVSSDGTALVSTADRLIWLKEGMILNELTVQDQMRCLSLFEDGALAVIERKDGVVQIMTKGGIPVFTYNLQERILASEIFRKLLVVCTDTSIQTFQFCKQIADKDRFDRLSSRKSLPLTSPLEEVWSVPVAENAAFLTGDVDGDGITEILLREESVMKLLDKNGSQISAKDFEGEVAFLPFLDFDGDTLCEIPIVFEIEGLIFHIYDWKRGFERKYDLESLRDKRSPEGMVTPFAVLDIDGDGATEILADVYVGYSCKPRGVASIDYASKEIEWFYQMGPCVRPNVVLDIDGDGAIDIVLGSMAPCNCPFDEEFPDCETYVTVLSGTGEELWKIYLGEGFRRVSTYAADVDESEGLEVIGFAYTASENWGRLFVLTCHGEYLSDLEVEYSIFPGAVIDIDADGSKEIVTLDSRGYVSIFGPDLSLKTRMFIKDSMGEVSKAWFNDLNGDGFCEIMLCVDNELYILDKNLYILLKKEFDSKIKMMGVANFHQCKNTLLVLSDKLYAFSYQDTGEPCPLWEITERNLTEKAAHYLEMAETSLGIRDYKAAKQYFELALDFFSQLEDETQTAYVSGKIAETTHIIFRQNIKTGTILLAVLDSFFCLFIAYSWITRKRWHRSIEGTLLLSLPVLLGLFQVYDSNSQQYVTVFVGYFVPALVLSFVAFLRQNILAFVRTIRALLSGHKDLLVLSIVRADGSYRVSVESVGEQIRPVKESKIVAFSKEKRENIIKNVKYMIDVLNRVSSEDQDISRGHAEKILQETGAEIYQKVIPKEFSVKAKFLLLEVEDTEIPWELMYSDNFFAVKYAVSRRIVTTESVTVRERRISGRRALIISDPKKNLPNAKKECRIVYRRLRQRIDTILIEGSNVHVGKIANLFGQGFDIIHYAGHVDNGLVLSDGVMTPEDVREYIVGTPVVFVNGCKSEELARAFLLGGAMAYVGTIHPVHDESAADIAADFYELCLQYQIGEALRRAREYHVDKHLVWASLVMYGDPTLKLL